MTLRFGDKVRLASRDRWRLWKITQRDPGEIESFEALYSFLEGQRARVRGKSEDAAFLRWLMEREWNRLSPGAGVPINSPQLTVDDFVVPDSES